MLKRYILTGTPGCGKTTLIRALEIEHYAVIEEAATDVIAYQQSLKNLEPWREPVFVDNIIQLQKQRQLLAGSESAAVQFYDRSPICTYALAVYLGFTPSAPLLQEIERITMHKIYEQRVFFIANLGFCAPSNARTISYEESLVFEKIHGDAYKKFGYECVTIPAQSISDRVEKILALLDIPLTNEI